MAKAVSSKPSKADVNGADRIISSTQGLTPFNGATLTQLLGIYTSGMFRGE